jgi:hypothetical protein
MGGVRESKPMSNDQSKIEGLAAVASSDLLEGERVCENDFVFLDHAFRPFRVRKRDRGLWLHYWSKSKQWVTLRECTDDEALQYIEDALKPGLAKYYEAGVPFLAS